MDIDEVLIFSNRRNIDHYDFLLEQYQVLKRPYLDLFIKQVSLYFDIAVWSHATTKYVEKVIKNIFPPKIDLKFVWCRDRCTKRLDVELRDFFWLKNFKKVKNIGYDMDNILILEDDPRTIKNNYGNYIPIKPFHGDKNDDYLLKIIPFLLYLNKQQNVRQIEKRYWDKE